MDQPESLTFAVWLKLGELRLRSIGPISDRGFCAGTLPFILIGDEEGVFLLIRSGGT
jgi:hypothetical protein